MYIPRSWTVLLIKLSSASVRVLVKFPIGTPETIKSGRSAPALAMSVSIFSAQLAITVTRPFRPAHWRLWLVYRARVGLISQARIRAFGHLAAVVFRDRRDHFFDQESLRREDGPHLDLFDYSSPNKLHVTCDSL